jgi:multicomponent Na+:H+ antiporter subunit D
LFSGLLSKVGVYAIYRLYSVVFAGDPEFRPMLLVVACVTMVVGVLGAVGRDGMREILSFHMVSQVGYLVVGVGLFGTLGLTAGIFYMLQYIVVKTSLFLSAGAVETIKGTGLLARLGGVAKEQPLLAVAFIGAALSLAGIPPFSGFFAKVALIQAAFELEQYLVAATAVGVSFFTLMSMIKIYNGVFAQKVSSAARGSEPPPQTAVLGRGRRAALVGPALFLATITLVVGLWPQGLIELSGRAANSLIERTEYVRAVLDG